MNVTVMMRDLYLTHTHDTLDQMNKLCIFLHSLVMYKVLYTYKILGSLSIYLFRHTYILMICPILNICIIYIWEYLQGWPPFRLLSLDHDLHYFSTRSGNKKHFWFESSILFRWKSHRLNRRNNCWNYWKWPVLWANPNDIPLLLNANNLFWSTYLYLHLCTHFSQTKKAQFIVFLL